MGGVMKLWTPHETIEFNVRWDIVLCMLCVTGKHYRTGKKNLRQTIETGVLTQIKCNDLVRNLIQIVNDEDCETNENGIHN